MQPALRKLTDIASKKERLIIGLMSGTSMDGLDIALCRISGAGSKTTVIMENFVTRAYTPEVKAGLLELSSVEHIRTENLCIWHTYLAHVHALMVIEACSEWSLEIKEIDLIASHGHTLYHAPRSKHGQTDKPNSTIQIVEADHLAYLTDVITISDFRQKDIARGGEGAPLAAYGDFLLFTHPSKDRVLINLGGIANFTYLPAGLTLFPPISMDSGPASTLIDAATRLLFDGLDFDEHGNIAKKGRVNKDVLKGLKAHPYFAQSYPKTTGPEMFRLSMLHQEKERTGVTDMTPEDDIATLTRLTAETLSEAILQVIKNPNNTEIYVSGGGVRNDTLMQWLKESLGDIPVDTTQALGLDPDAKEAVLFAVLANETICGDGQLPALGKISLP